MDSQRRFGSIGFLVLSLLLFFTCKDNPTEPDSVSDQRTELTQTTSSPEEIYTGTTITDDTAEKDSGRFFYFTTTLDSLETDRPQTVPDSSLLTSPIEPENLTADKSSLRHNQ